MNAATASNEFYSLGRYGLLTKKEIFKWRIHASVIENSDSGKRSDVFTFGPLNDFKFYLMLPSTLSSTNSEITSQLFSSTSQFHLFLCRICSNLKEGKSQLNEYSIKVAFSLLDLRERLHHTCERTMHGDTDRVQASFDRSCCEKYHLTFLRDGYITIHCSLDINEAVVENGTTPPKETAKMMTDPDKPYSTDLIDDFSSLLERGLHSDVTLSVDGKEFLVHRAILSARSPVFSAMFEHNTVEQKENRVVIEDVSADTVSLLLRFIYTGKISELSVQAALCLFVASDKYTLPKLKKKCSRFLCSNLTSDMMLNVLITANLHDDANLKEAAVEGVLSNAVQVMKSDEWLMFLKEYPELANSIILRLAMGSMKT